MSAIQRVEPLDRPQDPVVERLEVLLLELRAWVSDALGSVGEERVSDAHRIDRIAGLERLRAATAAAQAAECVRFARSQVEAQQAAEVHPRVVGRGIADQIGLACRESPVAGSQRLTSARALWFDLPRTSEALATGEVGERVAEAVVTETRQLDARTRRRVDAEVVAGGLVGMGLRSAAAWVRRCAYRADPYAYLERGRTERKHRRVGLRPAPDTMAVLTGYLPVEQGVACWAALRRHTDTLVGGGDSRSGTRS